MNRYTPFKNLRRAHHQAPAFPENCCHICGADKMFFAESLPSDVLQVQRRIGKGAFGSVHEGLYYKGCVAVKQLKRDIHHLGQRCVPFSKNDVQRMEKEARILRYLKHPNILHVYAFTYNPPQIITEFCMNGSLRRNLYHKTELVTGWKCKLKLLKGVAAGMRYLHERDAPICHRDLKSENILIGCDREAIICDVGLSIYLTDEDMSCAETEVSGSLNCTWQAPEVITDKKYSEKSDVYSVGIIMWELITGQLPFGNGWTMSLQTGYQFHQLLKERVVNGERPKVPDEMKGCLDDVPVGYIKLMERCWSQTAEERPTFAEFDTAICRMWKACEEEARPKLLVPEHVPADITKVAKGRKRGRMDLSKWSPIALAFFGTATTLGRELAVGFSIPGMNLMLHDFMGYCTVGLGLLVLIGSALGQGFDLIKNLPANEKGIAPEELKLLEVLEVPIPRSPFEGACPSLLQSRSKHRALSWSDSHHLWQSIQGKLQGRMESRSDSDGLSQAILSEIKSFCDRCEQLPTEQEWQDLRQKLAAYAESTADQRDQSAAELFSSYEDNLRGPSISPLRALLK